MGVSRTEFDPGQDAHGRQRQLWAKQNMHSDTEDGQGHDGDEDAALRRRHFPVSSPSGPAQVSGSAGAGYRVTYACLRPRVAGTAGWRVGLYQVGTRKMCCEILGRV